MRARAVVMEGLGDQLLAGAAFASNEHGRLEWGNHRDGAQRGLHFGSAPDDVFETEADTDLGAQRLDLTYQRRGLHGAFDDEQQLVDVKWFGDIVEGAELHGGDRGFHRLGGGKHDDLRGRRVFLDLLQDLEAVEARHQDVEQDDIERPLLDQLERLDARGSQEGLVAVLEHHPQGLADARLVVND